MTARVVAAVIGALVAVLVLAEPAHAAPDVTAAPTTDVATGDVVTIDIDGAAGYDGAAAILITACGNADGYGIAVPAEDPGDCWSLGGPTGFAAIVGPVDGVDYQVPYEWHNEGIGPNGARCRPPGPVSCRLRVVTIGPGFTVLDEHDVTIDPALPEPLVVVTGPTDGVFTGSTFDFALTNISDGIALGIATCGNAAADGTPIPASQPFDAQIHCAYDPASFGGLDPGPGNELTSVGVGLLNDRFATYAGTLTWVDPMPSFGSGGLRCIADGERPCGIWAGGGSDGGTFIPVTPAPVPTIVAGFIDVTEGDAGSTIAQIPVTLSEPFPAPVRVDYATIARDATPGVDFVPAAGTLTFPADTTSAVIEVEILGDTLDEVDEFPLVGLDNPVNATVGGVYGLGGVRILDDDDAPRLVPGVSSVIERDGEAVAVSLPITLSAPSSLDVTFSWTTLDQSATAGEDYGPDSGVGFIPAGDTTTEIELLVVGDDVDEGDELFFVRTHDLVNARPGGFFGLGGVRILDDDRDCAGLLGVADDLSYCDLEDLLISALDLSGVDLTGADLRGSRIVDVDLGGAVLDEADLRTVSVVNSSLVGASAVDARIDAAGFLDTDVTGADLRDSSIQNTVFLVDGLTTADVSGVRWGGATICPDGTTSGHHSDTCREVPVQLRAGGSTPNDDPVSLDDTNFFATFHPGPGYSPLDLGSPARFGDDTRVVVESFTSFVFDSDGDGLLDRTYGFPVAGSPLVEGIRRYCVAAPLPAPTGEVEHVYGCADLEVDSGTTMSPPVSPPLSGGGAIPGLVPFMTGPIGLAATAGGVGLIFLLGASRTVGRLEGTDDETVPTDDRHGDGDPG